MAMITSFAEVICNASKFLPNTAGTTEFPKALKSESGVVSPVPTSAPVKSSDTNDSDDSNENLIRSLREREIKTDRMVWIIIEHLIEIKQQMAAMKSVGCNLASAQRNFEKIVSDMKSIDVLDNSTYKVVRSQIQTLYDELSGMDNGWRTRMQPLPYERLPFDHSSSPTMGDHMGFNQPADILNDVSESASFPETTPDISHQEDSTIVEQQASDTAALMPKPKRKYKSRKPTTQEVVESLSYIRPKRRSAKSVISFAEIDQFTDIDSSESSSDDGSDSEADDDWKPLGAKKFKRTSIAVPSPDDSRTPTPSSKTEVPEHFDRNESLSPPAVDYSDDYSSDEEIDVVSNKPSLPKRKWSGFLPTSIDMEAVNDSHLSDNHSSIIPRVAPAKYHASRAEKSQLLDELVIMEATRLTVMTMMNDDGTFPYEFLTVLMDCIDKAVGAIHRENLTIYYIYKGSVEAGAKLFMSKFGGDPNSIMLPSPPSNTAHALHGPYSGNHSTMPAVSSIPSMMGNMPLYGNL